MAEEFNTDGMLDMFLYESTQLLERLESIVLEKKDASCFDENDINEIFRVMHTIKGSSGIMMYENITKVSHKLEDIFFYLRENNPDDVPHVALVEKVLDVSDFITEELEKIRNGESADGDPTKILEELDEFLEDLEGEGETSKKKSKLSKKKDEEPTQFYIAPVASADSRFYRISIHYRNDTQMSNIRAYSAVYALKEVAEDILYIPDDIITNEDSADVILMEGFQMLLQAKSSKDEILSLVDNAEAEKIDIEEITAVEFGRGFFGTPATEEESEHGAFSGIDKKEDKAPTPGDYVIKSKETGKGKVLAKNQTKQQSIISVKVEKMDALMDLIGEIVIAEAVVLQNQDLKVPGLELSNFQKASAQLTKITTELQEVIMSMRMMPLSNVFQKMKRIVFDVSRKLGKNIELEVIGEMTEVDKNIIEHISDPLMHLVRNAVDHGIEDNVEQRTRLGKPESGKITLEAKNEGGKVYISVRDDGKGLNKEKIFAKAIANGWVENKTIEDFTDKEIFRFITLPGFSTKEVVTEYSGRGVGMDVVVKNIQSIGGRLEIQSEEGYGSEMTLVIPLTLAIISGIVVEVGKSSFVIEMASIKEFVRVEEDMLIQEPDGEEYIVLRGECLPFLRLGDRYHLDDAINDIEEAIVVVVEHEDQQICILVDRLVQEQEIVVKPIPSYVKKVKGLSGCTQLGDGSIALILDIAGLIQEEERS